MYNLYSFDTVDEAIKWHKTNDAVPCVGGADGLWRVRDETFQAFKNCTDGWTIQKYQAPDPANYINGYGEGWDTKAELVTPPGISTRTRVKTKRWLGPPQRPFWKRWLMTLGGTLKT